MARVGSIEYFKEMKEKAINQVQDLTMEIDSLRLDAYELEQERNEYLETIKECNAEIKNIEEHNERELHDYRMKTDMVYHAVNTPSQKRLLL